MFDQKHFMANSSRNRSRGMFHLVVGGVLFAFELYLLFVQYQDWQAEGSFSTYTFVINVAALLLAGYFLRAGWEMRRNRDDLLD